jgi:hypothetical protein
VWCSRPATVGACLTNQLMCSNEEGCWYAVAVPWWVATMCGCPTFHISAGLLSLRHDCLPVPPCCFHTQDLAWGYLATGSQALRQAVLPLLLQRTPRAARLLHPTLRRCPAYHKGRSYAAGVLKHFAHQPTQLPWHACRCLQRLIAAELWELWPWQLEVSQQLKQLLEEEAPPPLPQQQQQWQSLYQWSSMVPAGVSNPPNTAASSTTGSNSSSSSRQAPEGDLVQDVVQPLLPQAMPLLHASSSSRSRHWPAPPACQLPPVTQQQLQLALEYVCVTAELSPHDTRSGLMLLALLLLRAELPQRLAFLQGPWGGLLLAALQLYACDRMPLHEALQAAVPGLAADHSFGLLMSEHTGAEGLLEVLTPHSVSRILCTETSAAWLLHWLLLQPQSSDSATDTSDSTSSSSSRAGACSSGSSNGTTTASSSTSSRGSHSTRGGVGAHGSSSSSSSSRSWRGGPLDPDTSWRATPVVQCGTDECHAGV